MGDGDQAAGQLPASVDSTGEDRGDEVLLARRADGPVIGGRPDADGAGDRSDLRGRPVVPRGAVHPAALEHGNQGGSRYSPRCRLRGLWLCCASRRHR